MDTNFSRVLLEWLSALRRQWLMLSFMVGPTIGVALVAVIFGLPFDLRLLASVVSVFTLCLVFILLRGEVRLSRSREG